jgi:hypothetical protein
MVKLEELHFGSKPGVSRLTNRMRSIVDTIEWSINNLQPFPALILILSSIDILGSIQDKKGFASESHFADWAKNYLFKEGSFEFNEVDLYGARCAIIHTLKNDPRPDGKIRRVIVYGIRSNDDAIKKIKDPTTHVGVNVDDLYQAFKAALIKYLDYVEKSTDPIINANLDRLPSDYIDLIPLDME